MRKNLLSVGMKFLEVQTQNRNGPECEQIWDGQIKAALGDSFHVVSLLWSSLFSLQKCTIFRLRTGRGFANQLNNYLTVQYSPHNVHQCIIAFCLFVGDSVEDICSSIPPTVGNYPALNLKKLIFHQSFSEDCGSLTIVTVTCLQQYSDPHNERRFFCVQSQKITPCWLIVHPSSYLFNNGCM